MVLFVVGFVLSLGVTLGLDVKLTPDVGIYLSHGFGIYPSPGGTLLGEGGLYVLAIAQATAVGYLCRRFGEVSVSWKSLLVSLPVLFWMMPLGIDVVAAALVVSYVGGNQLDGIGATLFHYAAIPVVGMVALYRSRRVLVASVAGTVIAILAYLTPYGGSLPNSPGQIVHAVPAFLCVMCFALAPFLAVRPTGEHFAAALGTCLVVAYATTAHVGSGESFGLSVFAASRYTLPLVALILVTGQAYGRAERPTTAPGRGEGYMTLKLRAMILSAVALGALMIVNAALAVTVPDVPVDDYGNALLDGLVQALTNIFPFAAAITAFAIGVGMVKRWLGHRKATRV